MKRSRNGLFITLGVTFILMTLLVVFTARVIFRTAFSAVQELGDNKATAVTADLENYMDTAKSVLWTTADTVDHMVSKGATDEEIIEYITRESSNTEQQFDESYTGLYGVIRGNYVDGVGWVPPEDYDPTQRDWYKVTVAGGGDVVLVPPYVDAQTGNVIISVGRALSDPKNALAMDLTLSGVQEIVEDIQINGYGYGYIVNNDGMVIAHHDRAENGKNYRDLPTQHELFSKVVATKKGNFTAVIDGQKSTVFVDTVMDQWYLVIVTKNSELYHAPNALLALSILINLIVFALISVFYFLGYRSEQKAAERMEEMKEIERKKDFEAQILKLEKSAADSANKAKSDFLADMSHEIRTPINAVLGMNEMILHEAKDEEILDYATSIKSSGNTLLSIINTILDFSKIEDGRMRLVPVEFETLSLITGLVNSISERARTKGLEFTVEADEKIPSILLGDDVRISQVVTNLLTNAVKYTEKGSILLKITNLGKKQNMAYLRFSVKDTGIGIRKEDIDKLAISFERVDEQRNRHIEGTGLGISIVTKLLEMMDSRLEIESEYGVGSEFYFDLPIEVVDETPIGSYNHSPAGAKSAGKKSGSRVTLRAPKAKILLTDDNDMNRKVAANLLKLFGITPVMCRSGRETITHMEEEKYDILFLDHMMPDMDGIETLRILKERGLTANTKVIALTANAVVGAKEQYLEAGFDDYLSKPIQIPELEKMLRKYLPESLTESVEEEENPQSSDGAILVDVEKREAEKKRQTREEEDAEIVETGTLGYTESAGSTGSTIGAENRDGAAGTGDDGVLGRFREIGLDVEEALTYCAGDEDLYVDVIHDYADGAAEKIDSLNGFLKDDNLKDYKILIHSVKSSSKTIGAMELFEKARELEMAAADENREYIDANHEAVMEEYRELAEKIL